MGYYNQTRNLTTNITDNTAVNEVYYQLQNYNNKNLENQFYQNKNELNITLTESIPQQYQESTLFRISNDSTILNASFKLKTTTYNMTGLDISFLDKTILSYQTPLGYIDEFEYAGVKQKTQTISNNNKITLTLPKDSNITKLVLNLTNTNYSISRLQEPKSLYIDNENIYILDKSVPAIHVLNLDYTHNKTIGYDDTNLELNQPSNLIVINKTIYVTDTNNNKIIKIIDIFNITIPSTLIYSSSGISYPQAISYLNETILIGDTNNKQIIKYNLTTQSIIEKINKIQNNTLSYITDIEQYQNRIYTVESSINKVTIYNYTNGSLILQKNLSNTAQQLYNYTNPQDIFVNSKNIFIADTKNSRVLIYNNDYTENQTINFTNGGEPIFVFESNNKLYIIEHKTKTILIFTKQSNKYVNTQNITTINAIFNPKNIILDIGNDAYYNLFDKLQNVEFETNSILYNTTLISADNSQNQVIINELQKQLSSCQNSIIINKLQHCKIEIGLRYKQLGSFNISLQLNYTFEKEFDITTKLNQDTFKSNPQNYAKLNITCGNNCTILLTTAKLEYYNNTILTQIYNLSDIYSATIPGLTQYKYYNLLLKAKDVNGYETNDKIFFENLNSILFQNYFLINPNDDFALTLEL